MLTTERQVMELLLNERKIKILEAIITDYIATAEPIGSRTIAKKYNLGISPATIRNEMSDLEELGLIEQPHTSAGRVPSDKGYRMYVDNMMHSRDLTDEEINFIKNAISFNVGQIDYLMQQTAKALSMLTNYTTIVTEPTGSSLKLKHIQLVPIDSKSVVAVMITDDKAVKNKVLTAETVPTPDILNALSLDINAVVSGRTTDEMSKEKFSSVLNKYPLYSSLITEVFKAVISLLQNSKDVHMYTSGMRNLLGFPEFSNAEKAQNIFKALEEKDLLITLLGDEKNVDKIQILIGGENNMQELKDCSIVRANYKVGSSSVGRIGIIGPTRMNYTRTVSVLSSIIGKMNSIMANITDDGGFDE